MVFPLEVRKPADVLPNAAEEPLLQRLSHSPGISCCRTPSPLISSPGVDGSGGERERDRWRRHFIA